MARKVKIPTFSIQYILSMSAKVNNIFDSCNDSCEKSTFQSDEYDYMGNVICSTYANSGESEYQRVAKRDYGLTSSAAKEISMVENNEIGKKVRRYFIKCEEMVKKPYVPQTLQEALRAYADALDRKEQAEKEARMLRMINEEQKPKADYYDDLVSRGNNTNIRDTAKELGWKQNAFIAKMIELGILYRDRRNKLKPTSFAVSNRICTIKEYRTDTVTGNQTLFTVEGKNYLVERLRKFGGITVP